MYIYTTLNIHISNIYESICSAKRYSRMIMVILFGISEKWNLTQVFLKSIHKG